MKREIEEQQLKICALSHDNSSIKFVVQAKDEELASYEKNLTLLKYEFSELKRVIREKESQLGALAQQLSEVKTQCAQYKQKYEELCRNVRFGKGGEEFREKVFYNLRGKDKIVVRGG